MNERPKFFDDLAGVAGGALSALSGLREEMTALVKARIEEAIRKLDLVKREEFDAISELASRARAQAEALEARVAALESRAADAQSPAPQAMPEISPIDEAAGEPPLGLEIPPPGDAEIPPPL